MTQRLQVNAAAQVGTSIFPVRVPLLFSEMVLQWEFEAFAAVPLRPEDMQGESQQV